MNISLLIPSRNGVEFLEWSYNSIRKNQGNHFVEILVLDDKSDKDNTWEWCLKTMELDANFKAFKNNRIGRLGISGGFKFLSQQATQEVILHWHNDMFLCEGVFDVVSKVLYQEDGSRNEQNVVCLTRIEPPIYGTGVEKIVWKDAPIELEDWDELKFLNALPALKESWNNKSTQGHFVPFFMFREQYNGLGSNDVDNFPLQAREDSDFAFRLILAGFKTIQIPEFTFHFASRGNRRSKHESNSFADNPAWSEINAKSTRNFIRKWQTIDFHDQYLKPTPPKRYQIGFVLHNANLNLIYNLEPWCDSLYLSNTSQAVIDEYLKLEQGNTKFNLKDKVVNSYSEALANIIVEIDGNRLADYDFKNIYSLSQILTDSADLGDFELGNLKLNIKSLQTYESDLIVCKNKGITLDGSVE